MKKWVQKFMHQFELEGEDENKDHVIAKDIHISEELATVLFVVDNLSKYLFDIESHPSRKTRGHLEELGQELIKQDSKKLEKALFRFRQFYSSYRISEYSYIQKTFDDFRNIIWDFVEQLNDDLEVDPNEENLKKHFDELKEAVETNSIDTLKQQSRQFIDSYIEHQFRKEQKKTQAIKRVQKNLNVVKKQLVEANESMLLDHLTKAFNRKSFDEQIKKQIQLSRVSDSPAALLMLDIDHFKKVNDTYGHATGDAILIDCVQMLKDSFDGDQDFVARTGGEEFAIILGECGLEQAIYRLEKAMQTVRDAVYVHENQKIQFTISVGIAMFDPIYSADQWMKRADEALYASKNNGRDRYTVAKLQEAKAS